MSEPLRPPSIEQVCKKSLSLPCAPSLLPRLATALRSDDSSSYEIENLISLDSSLAAATLRLANSAAFGRGGIDSLEGAILRLGAKEIYRLAALVLVSRWEIGSGSLLRWEPGDFSRHALCVAIAAEVLAEATERLEPQIAYTAGLVCDLGKLALAHSCAEFYPAIRSDCAERKCTWEESEKKILGYSCTDVSERLLKAWKFPAAFVGAAQFMARPNEAPADVVPLLAHLHAAKYLAMSLGPGVTEDGFLVTLPGNFLREWGFTQEMLEEAMPVVLSRAVDRLGEKLSTGPVAI